MLRMADFEAPQLVFIDESGCDNRVGYRKTGWSPRGITPQKVTEFPRGDR